MLVAAKIPGREPSNPPNIKYIITPNAPMAIPSEPTMSNGLRPNFSTVNTASNVNDMFTTPIITCTVIGLSIPISSKIRGP